LPTETRENRADWNSFMQFIYELISGPARRNTFTRWELDLLFDLQSAQVRKSARAHMLRRYVKAVSQRNTVGASAPLRLAQFLATEMHGRKGAANFLTAA
jgi:hypothetical protein